MASTLSSSSVHRIIALVEKDDDEYSQPRLSLPSRYPYMPEYVNREWMAIYQLYISNKPSPPLDYLKSFEMALVLKGQIDDADVRAIFAHGKPLGFWSCPRMFVSKIVEVFSEMHKEPEFLDVAITALDAFGAARPSEAWSQVYRTHLPCYACSMVDTVEARSIPRLDYPGREDPVGNVDVVVEKFHVSSRSFRKQLIVGLYYELVQGMSETERQQSSILHKITIRLVDTTCSFQGRQPTIVNRSSATQLLQQDVASEVFGFLDRAHIGPSLLANHALHDVICQLKQRLPVHHLKCAFEQEMDLAAEWVNGAYWMVIDHVQRDLPYTDVRRFKLPSTAGAEDDCALIRHCFSHSHVADLQASRADFHVAIKMLARLASRNFSVGCMDLCADAQRLSDYRSMDVVFGGLRMSELDLSCEEHRFVELVKTTDFFRMSTVQKLRQLKLNLTEPLTKWKNPRGHVGSRSPLWVSGIYLLRNCEHYRVDYWPGRHLRSIERKIVRICEDFERGKIADIVGHFQLETNASQRMNYAFSRENLLVSRMKVDGQCWYSRFNDIEWDVYRFRNANTNEYLTACVGKDKNECFLHILKGEVFPDASFGDC
ncbi:hypothetical protein AAVH_22957 [Aphelenchoides avenae]|nr:hypothetical protein AAVH_22957 [Aphelenchus avenae]